MMTDDIWTISYAHKVLLLFLWAIKFTATEPRSILEMKRTYIKFP